MLEALYSRLSKIKVKSSADGEKYLSASSIRYVHATLRAALNDAVKKRILPFNPCYSVTLAARNKYVARTLTQDEIKVFLNACDASPIGLELTLMLMLGLRRGEALGLRFSDIDFERRFAHIQQQYTTCGKDKTGKPQWGIHSPKTKESDRIIGIPSLVLQKLIERQKVAKYDLVCCNDDGSPRNINTLEHAFKMFLAKNGLPEIRLHDLRHTYATQLRDLGVDITTISQVLGHTSIKTTADIYISRNSASASVAAKAIDDWI
jgi:integrase